ncbi:MAG: HAD family phosphatase [Candidatus Heimdallarchaeota archaeon]|nr:MAG: HAD family phosphatase [Candidatus Heimdallarchaeota archaeon]
MTIGIKAIIFDLDGTIVNSHIVQWQAFNEYLQQFKVEISWISWTTDHLGKKSEEIWRRVCSEHNISIDVEKAQKERRLIYQNLVREGKLREISGFTPFFTKLKKIFPSTIPIVIASNAHPSGIEASLKAINYSGRIKYYSSEAYPSISSKYDLLQLVAKDLQVSTKSCLIFEDSPHGAAAGKRNGSTVIIINSSNLPRECFNTPLIVDGYTDPNLLSYVQQLSEK